MASPRSMPPPPRVPHVEPELQAQEDQEIFDEEEHRPPSVHRRRLRDRKRTPKGSKWLLGIAIFYLIVSTVVLLLYVGNQGRLSEYGQSVFLVGMAIGYLITATLFGLHAYSRKQPVQACVIALALYTCSFLYDAITNPTLFQSPLRLAVAGIVFATLIMGIVSAYKQQAQMEDSVSHGRTASRRESRDKSRRSERGRRRVS